jgi:hypothetical protein
MSFFSGSSRSGRITNPDGTHAVECWQCREIVGETMNPITRVLCEVCQRALDGNPLPEEAVNAYRMSKARYQNVSLLIVQAEEKIQKETIGTKFSLKSMGGDLLQAVGLKKPKAPPQKSKQVVEQKKREGLFASVNLGSLEELDQKIKEIK